MEGEPRTGKKAAIGAAEAEKCPALSLKINSIWRGDRKSFARTSCQILGAAQRGARETLSNVGSKMTNLINNFLRNESGATAIEYGLIAALIAVVIIGAVQLVGTNLSTTFNSVATNIK
jgi:pilus assembly protein Flp/PilA